MSEIMDIAKKRGQSIPEVFSDIIEMEMNIADETVKKNVRRFYETRYKDQVFTQEEKLLLISGMGQWKEAFSWFIGDMAVNIEQDILEGRIPERSLNAYYDAHSDMIGMAKGKFYECKTVREKFPDFDNFVDVGIKNAAVLVQIKNDSDFRRAVKQVTSKQMPVDDVKIMVAEYKNTEAEEKNEQRTARLEVARKTIKYNVKQSRSGVIIDSMNFDPEIMAQALNYYEDAIKNYIKKATM